MRLLPPSFSSAAGLLPAFAALGLVPLPWPGAGLLAGPATALAAPGDLDLSFRGTGWTHVPGTSAARRMAVRSDGKIVVAGVAQATSALTVWRYHPDGSLDTSLNGTGSAALMTAGPNNNNALLLRGEGSMLVTGSLTGSASPDFLLASFLPNGVPDLSFGPNRDGVVRSSNNGSFNPVLFLPDGKVLVAGAGGSIPLSLKRWGPDGSPDASFGSAGTVNMPGSGLKGAVVLARQSDGGILMARESTSFELTRLLPDGSLDFAFGGDFTGTSSLSAQSERGQWNALTVLPDGKILAAGKSLSATGVTQGFIVARYLPDGILDPAFGHSATPGRIKVPGNFTTFEFAGMVVQNDGAIITAATEGTPSDILLARFTRAGLPDSTFGAGGLMRTDFGSSESVRAIALAADHKLLVAGNYSEAFNSQETLLVRYSVPGTLGLVTEFPPGNETRVFDFGPVTSGTRVIELTVHNIGLLPLTNIQAALADESIPGDYRVSPPGVTTLAGGAETSVVLSLTPSAAPGLRTATLRITAGNGNPELPPHTVALTGAKATPLEIWRVTWFGSPDNSGPGADEYDFDHDGLPNFMEYATRSHPHLYSASPCEAAGPAAFTYSRPSAALTGFLYEPQSAPNPAGPWTSGGLTSDVMSDDGAAQTVRVRSTASPPALRLFLRLHVRRL